MLIIIPVGLIARLVVLCIKGGQKACEKAQESCNKEDNEEDEPLLQPEEQPTQDVIVTSEPKHSVPSSDTDNDSDQSSTSWVLLPPPYNSPLHNNMYIIYMHVWCTHNNRYSIIVFVYCTWIFIHTGQ